MKSLINAPIYRAFNGLRSLLLSRFKILAYHSINRMSRDPYEVSVDAFKSQMAFLAGNGYKVITLQDAIHKMLHNDIESKSIVITFDDGFDCLRDYAFPVLNEYSFPATVFLPISYIGGIDVFSYNEPRPDMPLLDWHEIEKSIGNNIEYGSHSLTHRNMIELSDADLACELRDSKSILSKRFGFKFQPFAYPFGMFDDRVKSAVREAGYDCALCFGNILSNTKYTDIFEIKREKILRDTTLRNFALSVDIGSDFIRKSKSMIGRKFGLNHG